MFYIKNHSFLEFLHWKGYNSNVPNQGQYKPISTQDVNCKNSKCCATTNIENDLSNYRQFAALTTLPRKNRSSHHKDSTNRLSKGKGKL